MPSTVQQHALFGTFNDVFRQMNEEDYGGKHKGKGL